MKNILCAFILFISTAAFAQDKITEFDNDDPIMDAAVAEARSHLNDFLQFVSSLGDFPPEALGVKVAFPIGDNSTEVIFVNHFSIDSETSFSGRLANEPNFMDGFSHGDIVTFSEDQIFDWYIHTAEGTYGYFTVRVIAEQMDPEDAEALIASFAPKPVPDFW